jgi:hypothetical protein
MIDHTTTIFKPETQYLHEILALIARGVLRVPNFQRPFVWKNEDMRNLFDSILKGYPIGSLLFWEPESGKFESSEEVGPFKIPTPPKTNITLILDGIQRLSTLYGVLTPSTAKDSKWRIYYDLKNDELAHHRSTIVPYEYVPLEDLTDTYALLKISRRLIENFGEAAEEMIKKAESASKRLNSYKIATTTIKGGDLDSAVEIFSRLNSTGKKVSDLLNALTKNGLSKGIEKIQHLLDSYQFTDIEERYLMRSIFASAGLDELYKVQLEKFVELNAVKLEDLIKYSLDNLEKSAAFLRIKCNVPGSKLLPYSMQLILIGEFFRLSNDNSTERLKILKQWFWVTTYTGWFSGANGTKIKGALRELRAFARSQSSTFKSVDFDQIANPFPANYQPQSARVKAVLLLLRSLKPLSLVGGAPINAGEQLALKGYQGVDQILAYKESSSLANRIIAGNQEPGWVLDKLKNPAISFEILKSHAISNDAHHCLIYGENHQFINLREQELINYEIKFLKEVGVSPYQPDQRAEPEIDSDM